MSSAGACPSSAASASSSAAAGAASAAVVAAAAAGAGTSSAAPASSSADAAAAVTGAPAGSVFVKRAGDARARFAEVEIFEADTVTRIAKRASLELEWRTTAAYVDLFLVRTDCARRVEIGDESEGVGDALFSGDKLSAIGVVDGAFLLARLSSPPAAAPSECTRAARSLLSCSPSRGAEGLAGRARDSAGVCGALTFFRPRFHSFYPLQAAAAAVAMRLQQLAVAAAVKPDRLNSAKSWADWC